MRMQVRFGLLDRPRRLAMRGLPWLDARRVSLVERERQRAKHRAAGPRGRAGGVLRLPHHGSDHDQWRTARAASRGVNLGEPPPERGRRQPGFLPAVPRNRLSRNHPVEDAG